MARKGRPKLTPEQQIESKLRRQKYCKRYYTLNKQLDTFDVFCTAQRLRILRMGHGTLWTPEELEAKRRYMRLGDAISRVDRQDKGVVVEVRG